MITEAVLWVYRLLTLPLLKFFFLSNWFVFIFQPNDGLLYVHQQLFVPCIDSSSEKLPNAWAQLAM